MNLRSGPIIEMGGDFPLRGAFLSVFLFFFSIQNLKHVCYETLRYVVACGFSVNPLKCCAALIRVLTLFCTDVICYMRKVSYFTLTLSQERKSSYYDHLKILLLKRFPGIIAFYLWELRLRGTGL